MKRFLRHGLAPAALLVAASLAEAAPITGLFNTGVVVNGVLAPGAAVELHYELTSAPGGFTTAFVSNVIPASSSVRPTKVEAVMSVNARIT